MANDKKPVTKKKKAPNEFTQTDPNKHSAFALAEKLKERKRLNKAMLDTI